MQSFNVSRFSDMLGQTVKLKHILHLYEEVETALEKVLIKKTEHKFKVKLTNDELQGIKSIADKHPEIVQIAKSALAKLCIR